MGNEERAAAQMTAERSLNQLRVLFVPFAMSGSSRRETG